jgi:plasmid stability protein
MLYFDCMRNLTIRNVPSELAVRLDAEKRARGRSLNQTVLELLAQAVGLRGSGRRSNGLAAQAGTWSTEDVAEVEAALRFSEEVDPEVWR